MHSVRYEAFKLTKASKRKPTGAEVLLEDAAGLIAALDAAGLDGHHIVVGNNKNDLPPEGGYFDAEIGAEVVPQIVAQLAAVVEDQLPAATRAQFLAMQRFYIDAAAAGAGINMYPEALDG